MFLWELTLVSTNHASSNLGQVNVLLIHLKQTACLLYIPHAKSITGGSFKSSSLTPTVFDFLISEPVNLKKNCLQIFQIFFKNINQSSKLI